MHAAPRSSALSRSSCSPSSRGRVTLSAVLLVALLGLLVMAFLAAFALWLSVRPAQSDWTVRVPLVGPLGVGISVPRAIRLATDPAVAPWLHRRRVATPVGTLRLTWQRETGTLVARCAPCRLHVAGLGTQALELPSASIGVRRLDERRLAGEFASGRVVANWHASLARSGLEVSGELAPTPVADVYAALAPAISELGHARIVGEVAARWRVQWPSGRWSVQPRLTGFAVDGLGTQALATARVPARCAAPPPARRPSAWLARAVVAAEDQRYFEHPGYDLPSALQSFDGNQRAGTALAGASTLTQQLAKLLYTGDDRTPVRKLRELLYAVEMERTLGKARILDLYLAIAPWGDGTCGAHAAALRHIGKPAHALSAADAARLASRLRNPGAEPDPGRVRFVLRAMGQPGHGPRPGPGRITSAADAACP